MAPLPRSHPVYHNSTLNADDKALVKEMIDQAMARRAAGGWLYVAATAALALVAWLWGYSGQ